ncbi:hypothetical protein BCR34DRAFT_586979 [Clohesyomyces aquaticus]|uniref:Uncharacterized protein n=1 Tax=Clohesyomyces aquaticus TaxID=1231657 RepID=A0A1Y1ZR02_9PLEO|nr:hypothetical protein BCR34DRAFT_586979 [Clohesyomyces aquaticus]
MNNSSQKANKGKRKVKRPDPKNPSTLDAKADVRADVKEKRKAHALKLLEAALNTGSFVIQCSRDITGLLNKYICDYDLPEDHFDLLDADDRCDLYIQATSIGPPKTKFQHGQPTPASSPSSPPVTECDRQSEGTAVQERDEVAEDEDLEIEALEGDEDEPLEPFNVILYPRSGPEVVKAYLCRNEQSYISAEIIKRHRLAADRRVDGKKSIRLTWENSAKDRQGPKTKSTRFWIVDDSKVRNDLAFGTACDEPDEMSDNEGDEEEDHENDDSSQDGSDEEDAEDDKEGDDSETSEAVGDESDYEDAADQDFSSSDGSSYVDVTPPGELIAPSFSHPLIGYINPGSQAVGEALLGMMVAANKGFGSQPCAPLPTTKTGKPQVHKASSTQPSSPPKQKKETQRAKSTRPKPPTPDTEPKAPKKRDADKVGPKKRGSSFASHVSDSKLRKSKKKG